MNRLTVAGILKDISLSTSQKGITFVKFTLESLTINKDNEPIFVTMFATSFNDNVVAATNNGHYQIGNALVAEGYSQPSTYVNKSGQTKIDKGIILTTVTNLNLAQVLSLSNTRNQQPMIQQQVAQPMIQQQVAQPMIQQQVAQPMAQPQGVFQTTPNQTVQPVAQQGFTPTNNNNQFNPTGNF